jgi:tetratricopeptide (TPR) repeat protein
VTGPQDFSVENARLTAAHRLAPEHFESFQRLCKTLLYGPPFQLVLVDCEDDVVHRSLIETLNSVLRSADLRVAQVRVHAHVADVASLERRMHRAAGKADVVHLRGVDTWFDASRWEAFNLLRDRLAREAKARWVFWLNAQCLRSMASHAMDLWAWRSGVYVFAGTGSTPSRSIVMDQASPTGSTLSLVATHRRVAELRRLLAQTPPVPDSLKGALVQALSELLFRLADPAAPDFIERVALPFKERQGDRLRAVSATGLLARSLVRQGDIEPALDLLLNHVLPACEEPEMQGLRLTFLAEAAALMRALGHVDAALRLLTEEMAPLAKRLGDAVAVADAQFAVAEILLDQGHPEEAAMRVRMRVQPAYEKAHDARRMGRAWAFIARCLAAQGQHRAAIGLLYTEALRLHERAGDEAGRAQTLTDLASWIERDLQRMEEAVRLRREALAIVERQGTVADCLVAQLALARTLVHSQRTEALQEARHLLQHVHRDASERGLLLAEQAERLHQEAFGKGLAASSERT